MIIAGNGPYFSHYFQFLCWKTQNLVRVLCLIHNCGVITHCRVKQVYPLIKLHLWCPRLKKDGHLRCRRGICHLFWWLLFAKCLHVDEVGPGWGHPCHLDTFLVLNFLSNEGITSFVFRITIFGLIVYNRAKVYIHQNFLKVVVRMTHWPMKSNHVLKGPCIRQPAVPEPNSIHKCFSKPFLGRLT